MNTPEMVFVFGSNLAGIHGAGAAKFAREHRGAIPGVAIGHIGKSYAIPTKGMIQKGDQLMVGHTLPLNTIRVFVEDFLEYARNHPEYQFQVTCIGCGLAGLEHKNVAPMFDGAPPNCWFDTLWGPWLDVPSNQYWGTF